MSSVLRAVLSTKQLYLKTVFPRCNISQTSCVLDKPSEIGKHAEESSIHSLQKGKHHKVDNLEKRFLVWAGKYKSVDEVPPTVPQETMEKARNKARIKISNYMIAATIVACIGFVYSGKQAAKRGESVRKMNVEWHQQMNVEADASAEQPSK